MEGVAGDSINRFRVFQRGWVLAGREKRALGGKIRDWHSVYRKRSHRVGDENGRRSVRGVRGVDQREREPFAFSSVESGRGGVVDGCFTGWVSRRCDDRCGGI